MCIGGTVLRTTVKGACLAFETGLKFDDPLEDPVFRRAYLTVVIPPARIFEFEGRSLSSVHQAMDQPITDLISDYHMLMKHAKLANSSSTQAFSAQAKLWIIETELHELRQKFDVDILSLEHAKLVLMS